jgi:hypothetical protein
MLDMLNALWRPATAGAMALVVMAISLGWLPASAEPHANAILTAAGGIIAALAASRAATRVGEVRAASATEQAKAKAAEFLGLELRGAAQDERLIAVLADEVARRLGDKGWG